jgi:arylformamidase
MPNTGTYLVGAGVSVVGIDSVNIDDTHTLERPIQRTLLGAGVPIVEHICRLGDIGGRPFTFTALPAPVRGMGSFPVRAVAVVGA